MSWTTLSAATVGPEPITVTAQHDPSALTMFLVPSTNSVAPLQSTVCSRPMPVTWGSPFLACPVGAPAAEVKAIATAQAATVREGIGHLTPVLLPPWRVICSNRAYVFASSAD